MIARTRKPAPDQPKRRILRTPANGLWIGLFLGLFAGQSISAATLPVALGLISCGFVVSLILAELAAYVSVQSQRKACDRAVSELERRMERHIPKRRVIAHGGHSHRPHNVEESESEWMPVARRSRTAGRSRH